ncbi:hypothetical protein K3729_03220 [Rhodobacteraceae bacterium S2214]|nr:hypothetical protein K3729_03220 [Rhodobacteraceae bacterium S2214]
MIRVVAMCLMLAGCDDAALVFDVDSDSLRPEQLREPFGGDDLRLEL